MPAEVAIELKAREHGVAVLTWSEPAEVPVLVECLRTVTADAWERGIRRVEASVVDTDVTGQRALQLARFRLEGRRRAAVVVDGVPHDLIDYAVLAIDPTEGMLGFTATMDSVLPRKRVIGHGVGRDLAGKVLLLETSDSSDLQLPGGVINPGESPRQGTVRAISEQLGIRAELGAPQVIDWLPSSQGWSDSVVFVFEMGTLSDEQVANMRFDSGVAGVRWVDLSDLSQVVPGGNAKRILRVLAGGGGYTEGY